MNGENKNYPKSVLPPEKGSEDELFEKLTYTEEEQKDLNFIRRHMRYILDLNNKNE